MRQGKSSIASCAEATTAVRQQRKSSPAQAGHRSIPLERQFAGTTALQYLMPLVWQQTVCPWLQGEPSALIVADPTAAYTRL
jgi:hypothetical protein